MLVAGVTLLAVGSFALVGSTIIEWKRKEPLYAILMKISTGVMAIGTIIFGIGMAID